LLFFKKFLKNNLEKKLLYFQLNCFIFIINNKLKKSLLIFFKILIVSTTLFYLIKSGRLNFEKLMLFSESPQTFVLIFCIIFFAIIPLSAFRWWLLLKAIGVPLKVKQTFALTWIGNFFNTTLPGAVTGDFVKGYYVIKTHQEEGRTRAFITLIIDRFVGLFGLIMMAFLSLLFNYELIFSKDNLHSLAWMITILFVMTVIFYTIVVFPFKENHDPFVWIFNHLPARKFSLKVYFAFRRYKNQKKTLIITLLTSICIHTLVAIIFFKLAKLIGIQDMELATQFFLMPIGLISVAIPIAPGGIGIGHAAFESLYQIAGLTSGADVFNLFVIVQLGVYLFGGIPYFLYSSKYKIPKESQELKEKNKFRIESSIIYKESD